MLRVVQGQQRSQYGWSRVNGRRGISKVMGPQDRVWGALAFALNNRGAMAGLEAESLGTKGEAGRPGRRPMRDGGDGALARESGGRGGGEEKPHFRDAEFNITVRPQGIRWRTPGAGETNVRVFGERLEPRLRGSHVVHSLGCVHVRAHPHVAGGLKQWGPGHTPCPRGGTKVKVKAGRGELREHFCRPIEGTRVFVADRPGVAPRCDLGQPRSTSTTLSGTISSAK